MLHLDTTELAKIVTSASQFVTIYIDKDTREEDVDSLLLSQNLSIGAMQIQNKDDILKPDNKKNPLQKQMSDKFDNKKILKDGNKSWFHPLGQFQKISNGKVGYFCSKPN